MATVNTNGSCNDVKCERCHCAVVPADVEEPVDVLVSVASWQEVDTDPLAYALEDEMVAVSEEVPVLALS